MCSEYAKNTSFASKLSLYPSFLIDDDLFETLNAHFAVDAFLNDFKEQIDDSLNIHCCVIPRALRWLYDSHIKLTGEEVFGDTAKYLVSKGERAQPTDIKTLKEQFGRILTEKPSSTIVVLVDRRLPDDANVFMFACDDFCAFPELRDNHFLGMDFAVSRDASVRAWLTLGDQQRLRFFPEQIVSVVPRLFAKQNDSSQFLFLQRVYGDALKHGMSTDLSDAVFEIYYKRITGYDHIAVNYQRRSLKESEHKAHAHRFGFIEYLKDTLEVQHFEGLNAYLTINHFDSEALFADILQTENNRFYVDQRTSNLGDLYGDEREDDFMSVKLAVLKYKKIECTVEHVLDLSDCPHLHRVVRSLKKFKQCAFVFDQANVSEFDLSAVISDFDHLMIVHNMFSLVNRPLIRQHIAVRVGCDNGAECKVLLEHSQRKREDERAQRKQKKSSNIGAALCEVTRAALCSVHCYALHSENELYRLSGASKKFESRFSTPVIEEKKDGDDETTTLSINFGDSVLKWLPHGHEPQFPSFSEEIVNNPTSSIDEELFEQYKIECLEKIKGTTYLLDEMMALKLYADTTNYQSALRRAHWTTTPRSTKKQFYQWALTLYRAHLYHAVPVPGNGKLTHSLYHGLTKLFAVGQETPIYYGPFSTTLDINVANSFSKGVGLRFLLKASYSNPLKRCVGIDMQWISCFKNEKEILLLNQVIPIQSTKNFEEDSTALMKHFLNTLLERKTEIVDKEKFFQELGFQFDSEWLLPILGHPLAVKTTRFKEKTVLQRLCEELGELREIEIELKVSAHRGHFDDDCHPRNLLDGKEETYYMSKYGVSSKGDWIEFEMCEEAVVIPSKICIRNYHGSQAIKVISLSIGTGDGSWHKLVDDIEDIQISYLSLSYQTGYDKTGQEFVFGELLVTPQWIRDNKPKHIRMEIRENYGDKYRVQFSNNNFFYDFSLFGVCS